MPMTLLNAISTRYPSTALQISRLIGQRVRQEVDAKKSTSLAENQDLGQNNFNLKVRYWGKSSWIVVYVATDTSSLSLDRLHPSSHLPSPGDRVRESSEERPGGHRCPCIVSQSGHGHARSG